MSSSLFVIKIGGNIIDHPDALSAFLDKFSSIKAPKILVHGGGKIATKLGEKLGIVSQYVDGRRITNDETIDLVTMVYGGLINKQIVAQLQTRQTNAIGLTGADGNCIPAHKRPVKEVDFGWVGDVETEKVNTELLSSLLHSHVTPVFAPLTHDQNGHILNTNADTIASSLAIALSSIFQVRLIYCFEKKGVLENVNDDNSVIRNINAKYYAQLKAENKLFEGILPKLDNAFSAIQKGVKEVLIGHADDIITNTTAQTTGTLIEA